MRKIPYGKQNITDVDIEAVSEVLRSDFLTQGPTVDDFEKEFAEYVGSKYAVAVSNGTAALHLSCLTMNVAKGQKVITTSLTFAATANSVLYCGAEVVFVDIDPKTYLIDLDKVRLLLENSNDGIFSGIIPVDFSGRPVEMRALRELADKHNLWIIEDACHAPGAFFDIKDPSVSRSGSGYFADLAIFSFHPVKHIACGEGGMITTNDERLYERLKLLRTHGIVKDSSKFLSDSINKVNTYPKWYMEMQVLGYNYRLSDIQAALGLSQLKRAEEGVEKRRIIAKKYYESFKDESFILGQSGIVVGHAYHLYIIEVANRDELYDFLRTHGVFAQIHYVPCHLMPYYNNLGWRKGDLLEVEKYYSRCLSLPIYPELKDEELLYVITKIKDFYKA